MEPPSREVSSDEQRTEDIVLVHVRPLMLGIGTIGSVFTPRNIVIPTRKGEIFSTVRNQHRLFAHYSSSNTLTHFLFLVSHSLFPRR